MKSHLCIRTSSTSSEVLVIDEVGTIVHFFCCLIAFSASAWLRECKQIESNLYVSLTLLSNECTLTSSTSSEVLVVPTLSSAYKIGLMNSCVCQCSIYFFACDSSKAVFASLSQKGFLIVFQKNMKFVFAFAKILQDCVCIILKECFDIVDVCFIDNLHDT